MRAVCTTTAPADSQTSGGELSEGETKEETVVTWSDRVDRKTTWSAHAGVGGESLLWQVSSTVVRIPAQVKR